MLYLESFEELIEVLKEGALDEDCYHASYISDADDITALLSEINKTTNIIPDYIDFTNFGGCEYYNFSLDYEDGELRYSISPAWDEENEEFYPDYGLCLIDDECVPPYFEEDYKKYGQFNEHYESPIRVCWGEEPERDFEDDVDCKKCTYDCDAPCCKKNETKSPSSKVEEKTKVDTDDNGKVWGFTKSWKDNNSHFTYSYHSTDEGDVLDLMKRFDINRF